MIHLFSKDESSLKNYLQHIQIILQRKCQYIYLLWCWVLYYFLDLGKGHTVFRYKSEGRNNRLYMFGQRFRSEFVWDPRIEFQLILELFQILTSHWEMGLHCFITFYKSSIMDLMYFRNLNYHPNGVQT